MAASTSSPAALSSSLVANIASSRSSVHGSSLSFSVLAPPAPKPSTLSCRAEKSMPDCLPSPPASRRLALALLAGVVAVGARVSPAEAAYGEAANIFGSIKKDTGFIPFSGNGFKLDIPSKWNPSKEAEFPGTVVRYEDNFDTNSNVAVMVTPTSKASIKDYGTPEKFLESVSFLLGKQAYAGKTQSEGGFDADAVATAAILESSTPVIDGKDYYNISVLTRTADGNEGGKHQLIVATVNDGKLYLCKAQAGDKRWFKGAKKFVEGTVSSFSLA